MSFQENKKCCNVYCRPVTSKYVYIVTFVTVLDLCDGVGSGRRINGTGTKHYVVCRNFCLSYIRWWLAVVVIKQRKQQLP